MGTSMLIYPSILMGSHTGIRVHLPKCLSGAGRYCLFILFKVDAYQTLQIETISFVRAALVTFVKVTDYFFTHSFIFFSVFQTFLSIVAVAVDQSHMALTFNCCNKLLYHLAKD